MRVLFVDTKLTGHHISYAKPLGENKKYESIYFLPEKCEQINNKQIIMQNNPQSLLGYIKWIKEILELAKRERVDIIHFLYGDVLCKFGGFGLKILRKFKVIITFHQIRRSFLRDLSRKFIFKQIKYGVVHTEILKDTLNSNQIVNLEHIEYPYLGNVSSISKLDAKKFFGINNNEIVIGAIGGTRYDKGLDILLEALKSVDRNFKILIAGKSENFSKEFIEEKSKLYYDKVVPYIKFLDNNELNFALNATDIVVLPYRKIFDGASGPLSEGVWLRKPIIGPKHGSLGQIIERYELGLTFETENVEDLSNKISIMIDNGHKWYENSEKYRSKLDVEHFKMKYYELYLKA